MKIELPGWTSMPSASPSRIPHTRVSPARPRRDRALASVVRAMVPEAIHVRFQSCVDASDSSDAGRQPSFGLKNVFLREPDK
jgi:hypothetical protein